MSIARRYRLSFKGRIEFDTMTKSKDQQQPPNSSPVCYANSRELREGYDMFPAPEPTLQKKKKASKPVGKK